MGMGRPSNTQNVTQEQRIPRELLPYLVGEDGILNRAQYLSMAPIRLPEFEVAGRNPFQAGAEQLTRAGIGSYMPALQAGFGATGAGLGGMLSGMGLTMGAPGQAAPFRDAATGAMLAGAGRVASTGGAFDPSSYQAFMDPFLDEVVSRSEQDILRQGRLQAQDLRANAVSAGAFGGSRAAIAERELGRNVADQQARTTAELRSQGFGSAMEGAMRAFESQQGRLQGAGQALAQIGQGIGGLGIDFSQLGLQAGGQMGQLGEGAARVGGQFAALGQQGQDMQGRDINLLSTMGGQLQAQRQAELDAQRQSETQNIMMPFQQLGFFSDIFQGSPTGMNTFTSQNMAAPNPGTQLMGLGAGMYAMNRAQGA
jgi:hypothetical protein